MRRFLINTRYIEMITSFLLPQYCLLVRHSLFRFLAHARFTADEVILYLRIHKQFLSEMRTHVLLRETKKTHPFS